MSDQVGAERVVNGLRTGTIAHVRVAGTAIICILAAFGAAFLVARAVKHQTPAHAATPPRTTRVAATVTTSTTAHRVNAELVSQFTPVQVSLKRRPKPHHRHHRKPSPTPAPVVTTSSAVAATPAPTVVPTTPVYSAPVQSSPQPSQPSSSGSGSTTHKKKQSSGGSGTTTIGG
jgi:hypothetical protein